MSLVDEVDAYLQRTGVSPSRFGRAVARDPSLVSDLRRGRRPLPPLAARIRREIGLEPVLASTFVQALTATALAHGAAAPVFLDARPWASAGFEGEQVRCTLPGADQIWLRSLFEHEWSLPFLVADVSVRTEGGAAVLTALLLAER